MLCWPLWQAGPVAAGFTLTPPRCDDLRPGGTRAEVPCMNDTTKYVVSSTLRDATWRNSEIAGPYTPAAIRRVKQGVDRGIYVSGSGTLVRALLTDGLVDELHLFMFPVTRGQGPRLF